MATLGMSDAEREAVEKFRRDVVEPSMTEKRPLVTGTRLVVVKVSVQRVEPPVREV